MAQGQPQGAPKGDEDGGAPDCAQSDALNLGQGEGARQSPAVQQADQNELTESPGDTEANAPKPRRSRTRAARKALKHSTLIAIEVACGLVSALLIGVGVMWWRLSQGPIELNFLRQQVEAELSEARQGRPVGIDRVELAWSSEASTLELRAVNVAVKDSAGKVLTRFNEARIELGVAPLIVGRIGLTRADLYGGEVSLRRRIDGAVLIAFGPQGTPPDIIIPPPPLDETPEQRVQRLLDGMKEAFAPVGPGARLQHLGARDLNLSIVDEGGGAEWSADAASLDLSRTGEQLSMSVRARLEAAQQGAKALAPASLDIATDTNFQSAVLEFGADNVRPRALLSATALGPFAGLDAPLTARVSIAMDRTRGVTRLEGEATLGKGVAEMAGDRFELDGGSLHGRYDLDKDELIIDRVQLAGAETRIRGDMHIRDASKLLSAAPDQPAAFSVALPSMTLDVPGVFTAPINLNDVELAGDIRASDHIINIERLKARRDQAVAEGSLNLSWGAPDADGHRWPTIKLDATVAGDLSPLAVMQMWPIGMGEGAREYVDTALKGGVLTDAVVHLDVQPRDLQTGVFRNQAADVRFNFRQGQFQFIDTMSPLTDLVGSAVVLGNRFNLTMESGRLNGIALTRGRIEIPRLKPEGAMATIVAHGEGEARQALELLVQKPLDLTDRLPVSTESAAGRAVVDFRFQRPNEANTPFERMRFNIDGRIDNFSGAMTQRRMNVSQGRLEVHGDQRAVTISGPVKAGTSAVNVQWKELIGRPEGQASSQYQISGDFDARDLERLGYPLASYATGRVGVVVSGDGIGFDVSDANVQLDLRDAAVSAPRQFWVKPAGEAATASFDVARGADGAFLFSDLSGRASGLVAQGELSTARDGRLISADISRLAIDGRSDAQISARRAADGALDVHVTGDLFDGAPFMENDDAPRAQSAPNNDPPMRIAVDVGRLKLRGGASMANADVDMAIVRGALARLTASGRTPGGGAFRLALGPRPDDPQGHIMMSSDDAGFAMRALTGTENVQGGTATATGVWRPGPPTTAEFTVRLRDFQVVRLPAMARLLSVAGSLTGLVETLNGDGIGFNSLDAPVVFADNRLHIAEARAAGPSLGLTGSGDYDLDQNNLDMNGVVVPSYGLNSLLGAVPVVGDLFVSRRGEGVFGMTYSLNGPVLAPRVGVNPLSALTPGILRRIFEPWPDNQTPAPSAPPSPQNDSRTAILPDRGSRGHAP